MFEYVNCSRENPTDVKGFYYLHQEYFQNFHLKVKKKNNKFSIEKKKFQKIVDPNGNTIFSSINSAENIFEFNATVAGEYKFVLINNFVINLKKSRNFLFLFIF